MANESKSKKPRKNVKLLTNSDVKNIVVYNFKGGVGKTMTTINLAHKLAEKHKILLVDLDGQCNLSSLMNDTILNIESKLEEDETKDINDLDFDEELIDDSQSNEELARNFNTEFEHNLMRLWELHLANEDYEVNDDGDQIDVIHLRTNLIIKGNLHFLPGSHKLHEIESWINQRQSTSLYDRFKLIQLINRLAKKLLINIVIIDLNPGDSFINRSVLFRSNYTIVPTFLDHCSISSTKIFLEELMPRLKEVGKFGDDMFEFKTNIGRVVVNKFKTRERGLIKLHAAWFKLLKQILALNKTQFMFDPKPLLLNPVYESIIMKYKNNVFINLRVKQEQWKIDHLNRYLLKMIDEL